MVRSIILLLLLYTVVVFGCRHSNQQFTEVNERTVLKNSISKHFSLDAEDAANLEFGDSLFIPRIGLKAYKFFDRRRGDDFLKSGIMLIDLNSKNQYYSMTRGASEFQDYVDYGAENMDSLYKAQHFTQDFLLQQKYSIGPFNGAAQQLESFLNNTPKNIRKHFDRSTIDTLLRFVYFKSEATKLHYLYLISDAFVLDSVIEKKKQRLASGNLNSREKAYYMMQLENVNRLVRPRLNDLAFLYTADGFFYLYNVGTPFNSSGSLEKIAQDYNFGMKQFSIDYYFLGFWKLFEPQSKAITSGNNWSSRTPFCFAVKMQDLF